MFGAAEFVFGLGPLGRDPLVGDDHFTIRDGAVRVPEGPGLGLELDEAALGKLALSSAVITERTA